MRSVRTSLALVTATLLTGVAAGCGDLGPTSSGGSSSWPPEGKVTLVVPLEPGGGTDILAREFAAALETEIDAQVVVQNQPGGGTVTGMNAVHEAEPDGQTLMMVGTTIASVDAAGTAELTPEDFTSLGMVNSDPAAIAVDTDSEWKSIAQFVRYVRENPDEVRVATANPQGVWEVVASTLAAESNLPWRPIPAEGGAAPSITSVLGGRVEAVLVSPAEMREQVRAGNLRVLAVATNQRLPYLENVPTFEEAGLVPDPPSTFRPVVGPPGMSNELQQQIADDVKQVASSQDFKDQLSKDWLNPLVLDPKRALKFMDRQAQMYSDYFASAD